MGSCPMLCLTCLRVVNGFEPRCTKKGPIKCDFGLWIAVEDPQTMQDLSSPSILPISISGERIPCFITSYFGHDHTPLIRYFSLRDNLYPRVPRPTTPYAGLHLPNLLPRGRPLGSWFLCGSMGKNSKRRAILQGFSHMPYFDVFWM